jgi:hypothetical protein
MDSDKFQKFLFKRLLKTKAPKDLGRSRRWDRKIDAIQNKINNLKRLEEDIGSSGVLYKFRPELEKEIKYYQDKFMNTLIISELTFWWECAWFGAEKPENVARAYGWETGEELYDKIIELKNK